MDNLRLFTVSDCNDPLEIFGWWGAVWAETEDEALSWAREHYGGECHDVDEAGIHIVSITVQSPECKPTQNGVHRETRYSVLRQAGWKEEGESACDHCELYACGMDEHAVCSECYLCPECRAEIVDEPCKVCQ